MNKYYSYPNIELWQTEKWADKVAPLSNLIEYIEGTNEILPSDYVPSYDCTGYEGNMKSHPLYRRKTHGIDDPAVVKEIEDMGLNYLCTGQGGKNGGEHEHCWICLCPKKAIDDWTKLPVLLTFEREDESDPLWTMRALKRHWAEVEMLAKSMDFVFVIMVDEEVCYDKIYFNIMQEFSILFPCDINRFYLDVSRVVNKGIALKDVPGFTYCDDNGGPADPDKAVEKFGSMEIPVLNMVGRWGSCDSLERGLIMTYGFNEGRFDREWLVHSEVGKRMAQDMLYEYNYTTVHDPRFLKEMEDKGLVYEIRYNKFGDRYAVACPRQQYEEGTKIPVVLVVQEYYEGNEHLAVTAHSYCGEWLEIAAQGECALVIFALEDIVSNDRAIDMIKECANEYPFDLTRVYATGHSHDGYFSYAYANRNPDFFTAIAPLGSQACSFGMNEKPDYTQKHEIIKHDMPTCVVTGLCESRFPKDENEKLNTWVPTWKHVFMNHRIPGKTDERILAAFNSDNYTERTTCLAGDKFRTLWCDGIEFYIVDFINEDNKDHLRIIRQQNMPHTITPMMCTLSWDFLRRFKRDPETHEIIELY